jgi:DNA-binding HxlR family transcriptional regulator
MLGRTYDRENCSAARTLEIIGERWSMLILRDAMFAGSTRFTEFQRALGVAPNILSSRLETFVAAGLMQTRPLSDDSENTAHEYVLTDKGFDLQGVIIALSAWGDRWAAPQGPPISYQHVGCGGGVRHHLTCADCGDVLGRDQVSARPGRGARWSDWAEHFSEGEWADYFSGLQGAVHENSASVPGAVEQTASGTPGR